MARVRWTGFESRGEWLSLSLAEAWVEYWNRKYPYIHHWVEER